MANKTMSPLALQSMLGDISQRRALAMALRARESGGGQMVSGRYVPNFGALGGAISRGIFGDPLEQLRQEEQDALGGYADELAGATQGMLEIDPMTAEAGDFARRTARAQVAGVPQDIVGNALKQRDSWNTLNRMLATLQEPPAGAVAGGGAQPAAGGGAAPGGSPVAPSPGIPAPAPQGGMARAFQQGGGITPLSNVSDGKLVMIAAALPEGMPLAKIAAAEMKSREMKMEQGGLITRGGRPVGIFKDGVFVNPNGQPEDVTGAIEAARAGSKAAAEADARASRVPIEVGQGDAKRMVFPSQMAGYGGGQGQQAPQKAQVPTAGGMRAEPGGMQIDPLVQARRDLEGAILKIDEGAPLGDVKLSLMQMKRALAGGGAPAPAPASGGGYPLGVSMGETEKASRKADIEVDAANRKEQRGVQIRKSADRYEEVTKAYQGAQDMKPIIANMRKLDTSGVMTGPPQEAWKAFANMANSAIPGANLDAKRLANSQTFDSEISRLVQGIAKNFPGAQSDRELQQLLNSLPSRMQSPEARAQLYSQIEARIAKIEAGYRDASKIYRERGDLIGWEPPTDAPAPRGGGAVLRFDAQGNPVK